ncbi:unnamed protein product [Musa acuminata subsp. burmannicoides]
MATDIRPRDRSCHLPWSSRDSHRPRAPRWQVREACHQVWPRRLRQEGRTTSSSGPTASGSPATPPPPFRSLRYSRSPFRSRFSRTFCSSSVSFCLTALRGQIFDGHNGVSAAVFAKEHLLDHVMSAIPQGIGREEWLETLQRALVAAFVLLQETSGTTATLVVVDGWTVTVASVGDSRCILDSQDGVVSLLTVDHRLEENIEERTGDC